MTIQLPPPRKAEDVPSGSFVTDPLVADLLPKPPESLVLKGQGPGQFPFSAWVRRNHILPARLCLMLGVAFAPAAASAADRFTCKMIEKLIETTDMGLEAAADPAAFTPASGIATWAREAQAMADKSSVGDPLPDEVVAALAAMADAATSQYSVADAAPVLLKQGLIIQEAMPVICPGTEVPDLRRHEK